MRPTAKTVGAAHSGAAPIGTWVWFSYFAASGAVFFGRWWRARRVETPAALPEIFGSFSVSITSPPSFPIDSFSFAITAFCSRTTRTSSFTAGSISGFLAGSDGAVSAGTAGAVPYLLFFFCLPV